MVLFHVGTAVEALTRDNAMYVNSWYKGNIVKVGRDRTYLICFDGYSTKDNKWTEERDIRFPLEAPVFKADNVPMEGDRVEVDQRLKKNEPSGWFEATVTNVDPVKKKITVKWTNPVMNKNMPCKETSWDNARLISRGRGYTAVVDVKVIAPLYSSELFFDRKSSTKGAIEAWDKATSLLQEKRHTAQYHGKTKKQTVPQEIVRCVVNRLVHPNLEIGLIEDKMNPAKRFAFGGSVHGVFANGAIPKDTVLGLYTGVVKLVEDYELEITLANEADLVYSFDLQHSRGWAGGNENHLLTVDACNKRNIMSFINDFRVGFSKSAFMDAQEKGRLQKQLNTLGAVKDELSFYWQLREQNAEFVEVVVDDFPYVVVRSRKDIKDGEEILADYGNDFWSTFEKITERKIQLMYMDQENEVKLNSVKHDHEAEKNKLVADHVEQIGKKDEQIEELRHKLHELRGEFRESADRDRKVVAHNNDNMRVNASEIKKMKDNEHELRQQLKAAEDMVNFLLNGGDKDEGTTTCSCSCSCSCGGKRREREKESVSKRQLEDSAADGAPKKRKLKIRIAKREHAPSDTDTGMMAEEIGMEPRHNNDGRGGKRESERKRERERERERRGTHADSSVETSDRASPMVDVKQEGGGGAKTITTVTTTTTTTTTRSELDDTDNGLLVFLQKGDNEILKEEKDKLLNSVLQEQVRGGEWLEIFDVD